MNTSAIKMLLGDDKGPTDVGAFRMRLLRSAFAGRYADYLLSGDHEDVELYLQDIREALKELYRQKQNYATNKLVAFLSIQTNVRGAKLGEDAQDIFTIVVHVGLDPGDIWTGVYIEKIRKAIDHIQVGSGFVIEKINFTELDVVVSTREALAKRNKAETRKKRNKRYYDKHKDELRIKRLKKIAVEEFHIPFEDEYNDVLGDLYTED